MPPSGDFIGECLAHAARARAFADRSHDDQHRQTWLAIVAQWEKLIAEYKRHLSASRDAVG